MEEGPDGSHPEVPGGTWRGRPVPGGAAPVPRPPALRRAGEIADANANAGSTGTGPGVRRHAVARPAAARGAAPRLRVRRDRGEHLLRAAAPVPHRLDLRRQRGQHRAGGHPHPARLRPRPGAPAAPRGPAGEPGAGLAHPAGDGGGPGGRYLSPYFGVFLAASVLVGTVSVVAQILVAFGVHLAPERERGSSSVR